MHSTVENLPRPIAVVTGTSRDVGKYIALNFAEGGWDIQGIYRNSKHDRRQQDIIDQTSCFNVKMKALRADLLHIDTPDQLRDALRENFNRKAHALILNAAGGYKKPIEEAEEINVSAQQRLLYGLIDDLVPGAVIVFNTSYPSHRYHIMSLEDREQLEGYNPVAQTKNKFEVSLRSRIPELEARGIRLAIVVGNGLEDTFVGRVLQRRNKALIDQWLNLTEEGHFPTAEDMAKAVIEVVTGNYLSGYTAYVGIKRECQLYPAIL